MEVNVKIREKTGKEIAKKLRKMGFIPGVVYGHKEENLHISINEKDLHEIIKVTHGEAKLIKLKADKGIEREVIIKHIDRDPVTGEAIHVDFQVIHKGEEVHVDVPVEVVGTAKGIKVGGILEVLHWHIPVRGEILNIPPHITIDVSNLDINDSIHVKDLKLQGVKILLHNDEAIITVLPPKKFEEIKPVEEAAPEAAPETEKEEEKE